MDECRHIEHLQLARSHSIFNPQKWLCVDCSTTQSLWACLSCSHIACGRHIAEHALKRFQESSHPVEFEGDPESVQTRMLSYTLSAVVIHHGKGFGSGHYTAYCYNSEGGFWVHCNDSKLSMCTMDEVRKAQAYILFYTQRVIENEHSKLLLPELLSSSQHHSEETDASSNEVLS